MAIQDQLLSYSSSGRALGTYKILSILGIFAFTLTGCEFGSISTDLSNMNPFYNHGLEDPNKDPTDATDPGDDDGSDDTGGNDGSGSDGTGNTDDGTGTDDGAGNHPDFTFKELTATRTINGQVFDVTEMVELSPSIETDFKVEGEGLDGVDLTWSSTNNALLDVSTCKGTSCRLYLINEIPANQPDRYSVTITVKASGTNSSVSKTIIVTRREAGYELRSGNSLLPSNQIRAFEPVEIRAVERVVGSLDGRFVTHFVPPGITIKDCNAQSTVCTLNAQEEGRFQITGVILDSLNSNGEVVGRFKPLELEVLPRVQPKVSEITLAVPSEIQRGRSEEATISLKDQNGNNISASENIVVKWETSSNAFSIQSAGGHPYTRLIFGSSTDCGDLTVSVPGNYTVTGNTESKTKKVCVYAPSDGSCGFDGMIRDPGDCKILPH